MRQLSIALLALSMVVWTLVQAQEAPVIPAEESAVGAGGIEINRAVGSVARAAFTSGIAEREPIDNLVTANSNMSPIYFFTELLDLQGQTVTHRWQYQGEVVAEVPFEVGGPRWRVYSSKNMTYESAGTWYVDVVDGTGNVLYSGELVYTAAP